jgi:hypothetical protein
MEKSNRGDTLPPRIETQRQSGKTRGEEQPTGQQGGSAADARGH